MPDRSLSLDDRLKQATAELATLEAILRGRDVPPGVWRSVAELRRLLDVPVYQPKAAPQPDWRDQQATTPPSIWENMSARKGTTPAEGKKE